MARQVPDGQYLLDPFTPSAPVRSNIPALKYQAGGSPQGAALPLVGVVGLAGLVVLFHYLHTKGGKK
jgi:hypothetical protein